VKKSETIILKIGDKMETTITNTTPAAIALDDLLAVIFPPTGLLRLVGANGNDAFHRRIGGHWLLLGQERASLDAFISAQGAANVAFSPIAWLAPTVPSPITAPTCLWAGIRYACRSQQPHEPRPRVVDGERDRVRAQLAGLESPSVLIDEGDRMVAFWRLAEPPTEPSHLRPLLERLARHVGGDRDLADPLAALVTIPGTRNDNVYPARVVTVDASVTGDTLHGTPRRWTLGEIEHATAFGGTRWSS
jgi:hypothetical protein